jgi:hypothetical protein
LLYARAALALFSLVFSSDQSVSAMKPFVGFGVDDHLIRELMRFIKMICREFKKEDDVQVGGFPKSI